MGPCAFSSYHTFRFHTLASVSGSKFSWAYPVVSESTVLRKVGSGVKQTSTKPSAQFLNEQLTVHLGSYSTQSPASSFESQG